MGDLVSMAKQRASMGKDRVLKTFSFVPDDKLNWKPAPTSKSALHLVAHLGVSNHTFIGIFTGQPLPGATMEEIFAKIDETERSITTREEAVKLLEDSTNGVLAALDSLTPEKIAGMVELPFMTAPMAFFMEIPGSHMEGHAGQLDYLQTMWGDMDPHLG